MNLKEAFRFQNKLQSLMEEAQRILSREENVTTVKTVCLRSRVMEGAEDETRIAQPDCAYSEQITDIVRFLLFLLGEKEKLSAAIHAAKAHDDFDMDSEVGLNTVRQSVARTLQRMNALRGSANVLVNGGTGYRFNAEGNQVSYRCDVRRVTTINFDRTRVQEALRQLRRHADETSARIDRCQIMADVAYAPPFDVNGDFAESFEAFLTR